MSLQISKGFGISALVAIAFAAVLGIFFYQSSHKVDGIGSKFDAQKEAEAIASDTGKCGLIVSNPVPNETVAFPLTVKTIVNNSRMEISGCVWTTFEAQAGMIEVIDSDGVVVGGGVLKTTEEWMTAGPVHYNAEVKLTKVPATKFLNLVFTEDDPSGEGTPDTFTMPVKTI